MLGKGGASEEMALKLKSSQKPYDDLKKGETKNEIFFIWSF